MEVQQSQVLSIKSVVASLRENSKRYWSYVNSKLANKNKCLNMLKTSHGTIEDPKLIAEEMNDFFYKSFNKQSVDISSLNLSNSNYNLLNEVSIDSNIVNSIIRHLPNKFSEDFDGFSYAMLKGGGDILAHQLTRLFRLSFSTGSVPQGWKKSVILPIKKKSSSLKAEDYRPINIISCICRVFERIIRNAIFHYLTVNNRINKSQHGFLKGRSTTSALLSYANGI